MNTVNGKEIPMSKLVCPKGHNVRALPSGGYYCVYCAKDYSSDQLKEIPIDRELPANASTYRPTVYGRIN